MGETTVRAMLVLAIVSALFGTQVAASSPAGAQGASNEYFSRTWARHDGPVSAGLAQRTWMWGPQAYTGAFSEAHLDSPGGERLVQYFDKSRMEINNPRADREGIWYVTNGLLAVELISGRMQTGYYTFEQREPANVNVAGDWDDASGPTYATFAALDAGASYGDGIINVRLKRDGTVFIDSTLSRRGIDSTQRDSVTGHSIARPFWEFMNSRGTVFNEDERRYEPDRLFRDTLFATGRPVTRAFWANVKVSGRYQDVLLQCFERRCLTYTPGNPVGWRVEAGNVGQHYYAWRYGHPPSGAYWEPHGIAVSEDRIVYVASGRNNRILRFTAAGRFLGEWGSDGNGLGQLAYPTGIAFDSRGHVYVVENGNHRVQKFTASGLAYSVWGGEGSADGQFNHPYGIAIDADDNVYVSDHFNHRVQKFSSNGTFLTSWGSFGSGEPGHFQFPAGIAVSEDGIVYVADTLNGRVQMFTTEGEYIGEFGGVDRDKRASLYKPYGIAIDGQGRILVTDSGNKRIQQYDSRGTYMRSRDLSWVGRFSRPSGLALDTWGNIYMTDAGEYLALRLKSDGKLNRLFLP